MQKYIEEHLDEAIDLRLLADEAGYSPFHSARMFKELTGKSPLRYVRELRLTRAAIQMRNGPVRILDAALDFAFGSHEGFTRAFSRTFGMAPQEYRRKTPPISLFLPYRVEEHAAFLDQKQEESFMEKNTGFKAVFVQVIERPRRKALVRRA